MREILIEQEVERWFDSPKDLSALKEQVESGLMLEKGPPSSQETRDLIIECLARSTQVASDFLKIPQPKITLFNDWGDKSSESNIIMGKCDTDEWAVKLSPVYLEDTINGLEGREGTYSNISLSELASHEIYHLWESVVFPKTFAKHGQKDKESILKITREGESFEKWYKPSRSEKAADMFGRIFSQEMAWARVSRLVPDENVSGFIENLEHIIQ